MKTCAVLCVAVAMSLLSVGCTTKVVNERGGPDHTTVIERRPVVTDRTPDVQNNIHVDR